MAGADKAEIVIGGARLLDRVLAGVTHAERVIVVGPTRATAYPVIWTREEPPGGGPVAALAAGLVEVKSDIVVVLAVDLPFITRSLVHRLVYACCGVDGAIAVDDSGRDQPLAGAYRAEGLRVTVRRLATADHAPVLPLLSDMKLRRIKDGVAGRDCDTWDDVDSARARAGAGGRGGDRDAR